MGEHTETPWRVIRSHEIGDDGKIINTVYGIAAGKMEGPFENTGYLNPEDAVYYKHEHHVVEIGCDRDYYYPEAAIANKDDAEFICLAVNNHDQLVRAIDQAKAVLNDSAAGYSLGGFTFMERRRVAIKKIEEVLAKLKSASPGIDKAESTS